MNKYIFTAIVRDCLRYPKNLFDFFDMFFEPKEKDFYTVEQVGQMNYEIVFEVYGEDQRDNVKTLLNKSGLKYEESFYTSL